MQYLKTFFMNFNKKILKRSGTHISCVQNRLFISSECPFHTLGFGLDYFQVYIIKFFFYGYKGQSIGQPKVIFLQISKNHNKKTDNKKKNYSVPTLLLDHFYLLISLEGMSTFIRRWTSFKNQIWDVHLYNV